MAEKKWLLRMVKDKDALRISQIYRPIVEESSISFESKAPNEEEIKEKIHKLMPKYPWLVLEYNNLIAGYTYASPHRSRHAYQWSVESSVYIDPLYYQMGIGKALYMALFAILKHQGFFNIYAGIGIENAGSIAFHEACGFELVGVYKNVGYKFGAWHNVGWWSLLLNEYVDNPEKPKPLSAVIHSYEWDQALNSANSFLKL